MKYLIFCSVEGRLGETLQPYPQYSKAAAVIEANALLDCTLVKVTRARVKIVKDGKLTIVHDTNERD